MQNNRIQQLYHIYECQQLTKGHDYDCIIRSRLDLIFEEKVVIQKPEENTLYVKHEHDKKVCCDRFAYGDRKTMNIYGNRYNLIHAHSKIPYVQIAEHELYFTMDFSNVKLQEITWKYKRVGMPT